MFAVWKLAGSVCVLVLMAACGYANPYVDNGPVAGEQTPGPPPPDNFNAGAGLKPKSLPGGLQYVDLTAGTGAVATKGLKATVQYTGWLTNGKKFDSSRDHNQTFSFTIGKGEVIKGWDQGVPGMKIGGKRKLVIPPALGYGAPGAPPTIPANATLVFQIELVSLAKG